MQTILAVGPGGNLLYSQLVMRELIAHQRHLFAVLEEFFERATGTSPKKFAPLNRFAEKVGTLGSRATDVQKAFEWAEPELNKIYRTGEPYLHAAALGGIKAVMGGGAHFRTTQFAAAKRMILYTDTVLIPDPVLALIEAERPEERFHSVRILEEMFLILRLKPLVDADLGIPPVVVFPSFDRRLQQHDQETREKLTEFVGGTLGILLNLPLTCVEDTLTFATAHSDEFLEAVRAKELLVAPGGPVGEPLDEALRRYISEIGKWRTPSYMSFMSGLSDAQKVCNALLERFEPQFHLIDNAVGMRAQPLLSVEQQAYYFKLSAKARNDSLERGSTISATTRASIDALATQQFEWLSNATIDALVEMRLNNENERFRKRLAESTSILRDADFEGIDRVAAEVTSGIGGLLNDYRSEAKRLDEKYRRKYAGFAGAGWLSLGAFLIPYLAPLVAPVAGLSLAGKYAMTKIEEKGERKDLANSLVGILANAQNDQLEVE
jgi:hypothetical protein